MGVGAEREGPGLSQDEPEDLGSVLLSTEGCLTAAATGERQFPRWLVWEAASREECTGKGDLRDERGPEAGPVS